MQNYIRAFVYRPLSMLLVVMLASGNILGVRAQSVLPQGGTVAGGSATIGAPVNQGLTVNQASQNAIINWNSFSVGQPNAVTFVQPNASSAMLNRVTGNTPSSIAGQINANGQVYLVNPNGIAITSSGTVNVGGGFVASTLGISNEDFLSGKRTFTGNGASAGVSNAGTINVGKGGFAALLGGTISNSGRINVPLGKVGLGSGEQTTLDLAGDGFMQVAVPTGASVNGKALIENSGRITARGGSIELRAATVKEAVRDVVNVSGTLSATSVSGRNGSITIGGGPGGNVTISGRVNTAARKNSTSNGGTIAISGNNVTLDGARVRAASRNAKGGTVTMTGDTVALRGSLVDVSGKTGGGTALIGGDYLGGGTLARANTVIMDESSTITANATGTGKGGKVILWSDMMTLFGGMISAKGGATGGDGGFVETSSKVALGGSGNVDASAVNGANGQWLLDPADITIASSGTAVPSSGGTTTTSGLGITLSASSISTALNNGNNVTLITGSGGILMSGNITVNANIAKTAGAGTSTLTLQAIGSININTGSITATSGGLNVVLQSNLTGTDVGAVTINSAISTNGGFITVGGGANPMTTAAMGTLLLPIGVYVNAALTTNGGNVNIRGTGFGAVGATGVEINNTISAGAGNVNIVGIAGGVALGTTSGVYLTNTAASSIVTTTGSITINGTGNPGSLLTTGGNWGVGVSALASIRSTNGGTIGLTGTGGVGPGSDDGINILGQVTTTGAGNINLNGTTPGSGGSSSGIYNAGLVEVVNGTVNITALNSAASNSNGLNRGLLQGSAGIIRATGTGSVIASGTGGGRGSNNYGLQNDGTISVTTGTLSLTGIGGGTGGSGTDNYGIYQNGTTTASSGTISLTGTGGASSGTQNVGVAQMSAITTSGAGNITINGTGGGTGLGQRGYYNNGVAVTSAGGNISITGLASATATGSLNDGIYLTGAGAAVSTSGAGTITMNGTSRGTGTGLGVNVAAGATVTTVNGLNSVTGVNQVTSSTAGQHGVLVTGANSAIRSTGSGGVTLVGTGGGSGIGNFGVTWDTASALSASGSGTITLNGTGGGINNGNGSNYGIYTAQALSVGGTGGLTLIGQGGNAGGTGTNNYGVNVAALTTSSGAISVTGTGGNTSGTGNFGINQTAAITATGAGNITLLGTGGGTGSGGTGVLNGANIVSAGGNLSITGNASATTVGASTGLLANAGTTISTTGAGTVALAGTAAGTAAGAAVNGVTLAGGTIVTAVNGLVSVTGTNNSISTAVNNHGVSITGTGSRVTSTGTGGITLAGTAGGAGAGGSNYGVSVDGTSSGVTATLAGGNSAITVTGTGGGNGGTSANNYGVNLGVAVAGNGGLLSITGTGGNSSGASNYGINQTLALTNTGTGGITLNGTGGGTGTLARGIYSTANVTAGTGNVSLTGLGALNGTTLADGIWLEGNGVLSTSGAGNITLAGTGRGASSVGVNLGGSGAATTVNGLLSVTGQSQATGTAGSSQGIVINSSVAGLTATGTGGITLSGTGGGTGGASNVGVQLTSANAVRATLAGGNSAISITGIGGGTGGSGANNYGVNLASAITGNGGTLAVTGTGGNSSGANNIGINQTLALTNTGTGAITLNGTGGGTGTNASGYVNTGVNVTAAGGNIGITGIAGASGTSGTGISLVGGTTSTTGTGTITLAGTAKGTAGGVASAGVSVGTGAIVTAVNGLVGVTGINQSLSTAAGNVGVLIADTNSVVRSTGIGGVTVTGTGGGAGAGGFNYGVNVAVANGVQSTGSGLISLTGTGGGGTGSGSNNTGVNIAASLGVSGTGGLTLLGVGGNAGGTGNNNTGVAVNAAVNTSGAISLTGTGGAAGGSGNHGVVNSAAVVSGGGNISVAGVGGGTGGTNIGYVGSAALTAGGGNLSVTGTGATVGTGNDGINLTGAGTILSTIGSGTVTLNGTGGANGTGTATGVALSGGAIVRGVNGLTSVTGLSSSTGSGAGNIGISLAGTNTSIQSSGSGGITLIGTGGGTAGSTGGHGVSVGTAAGVTASGSGAINITALTSSAADGLNSSGIIGGASATGDITINTNAITLATAAVQTAGNISILAATPGTSVAVGTAASGTLKVDDAELALLNWGAGKLLTIGGANAAALNINTGVTLSNNAMFQNGAGYDITLGGTLNSTASANAVVLASGKNIVGGGSVSVTGGGRWLGYTIDRSGNDETAFGTVNRVFNQTIGTYAPALVTELGNVLIYASLGGTITLTANNATRTYGDSNPTFSYVFACVPTCTQAAALATGPTVGSTATVTTDAGTANITIAGAVLNTLYRDYSINYVNGTLTIAKANLTIGTPAVTAKTYDGTATAALTGSLIGIKNSDVLTMVGAGTFADANAGIGKTVTANISVTGAKSANYNIIQPTGLTGTINKATLTVGLTGTAAKTYDATTAATLAAGNYSISGLVGAETVTLANTSAVYADANAGTGKTVTASGLSISVGGGNYQLASTTAAAAIGTINKATLTIGLTGNVTKTYDATTAAALVTGNYSFAGLAGSDTVTLTGGTSGTYDNANVGTGKTVTVNGLGISGAVSGNYQLASTSASGAVGVINRAALSIVANNLSKTYGTADPTLTYVATGLQGSDTASGALTRVAGETVAGGPYAINQGTVTAGNNYTISYTAGALTINKATLTATLTGSVTKTYDATTAATLVSGNYNVSGIVGGDSVALTGFASGNYADANAGIGKTVTVNGLGLSGAAAGNYQLASTSASATVGVINRAALSIVANNLSKTYGTADPALTYVATGLQGSDAVSGALTRVAGETVAGGPYAINQGTVTAGNNYTLSYTAGALTINKATLTATLTGSVIKTYDATTTATLVSGNYNVTGIVGGDSVTLTGFASGNHADANAGTGKTVTVNGLGLSGSAAGNYQLVSTTASGAVGVINRAALSIVANNLSKTYGTADPALTYVATGLQGSDAVSGALTRVAGETVAGGPYAINQGTVTAGNNYTLSYTAGALTINKATLTATLTGSVTKTYDATTAATLVSGNYNVAGIVGSDNVVLSGFTSGAYADANVGAGKVVTVTGLGLAGSAAGNYQLASTTAAASIGVINRASLSIVANNLSKTYGTADPALTYVATGLQGSDTTSGALTRVAGETVAGGPYAINQGTVTASNNYTISYTAGALTINKATLTVGLTGNVTKTYDATTAAALVSGNYSVAGIVGSDDVALTGIANGSYADANAGTGKTVTVMGLGLSGSTASNYQLASSTASGAVGVINRAALSIVANNLSKTYGTADPALTYVATGLQGSDTTSGALTRVAGETVAGGPYAINQGTVTGGNNYTISYTAGALTINKAILTATLTGSVTKTYDATTAATLVSGNYNVTGIVGGDSVALTGFTAGNYADANAGIGKTVTVTGLGLSGSAAGNYQLASTSTSGAVGVINRAALSIVANNLSKTYGTADPSLTYVATGLQGGDMTSGALTRVAGETVAGGPYAINQGTVTASNNYTISYTAGALTINKATLTATLTGSVTKTYDATTGATLVSGNYNVAGVVGGDSVSLTGFTSGNYADANAGIGKTVTVNGLGLSGSAAGNYQLASTTASGAVGVIDRAALTIVADAKTKVYGSSDPSLTYVATGLQGSDTTSGALSRVAGENVAGGPYAINQGTVTAGNNYTVSYTAAAMTITPKTLTITPDALAKVYGEADPALTFAASGLAFSDTANGVLTGALTRAAGENKGTYAIGQGTLASNANYSIAFTPGRVFTIGNAILTVIANAQGKVYGDTDPTLSYSVSGFVGSDTSSLLTGGLARAAGENVGNYQINVGSLSGGGNYTISYTANNLAITPATLTVTANNQSKVYGAADPTLTYGYAGLKNSDTGSVFSGALSRATGENVAGGPYAISQGSVTAGSNYTIDYQAAALTITPRALTVTANNLNKTYGDADPSSLTYTYGSLANGDTASVFTGALARDAGENAGIYAVNRNTLSAGSNYNISYTPGRTFTIDRASLSVTANNSSKIYGDADPSLSYSYSGLKNGDTGAVFAGSLTRASGETVAGGPYAIGQGTLNAGGNYNITFTPGNTFTITPAMLTVTANSKGKTYGDLDPTFDYSVIGLKGADTQSVVSGLLTRDAGENVSATPYAINQGSLTANSNYAINFVSNGLTISTGLLVVNANAAVKTYGDADPASYTYTYSGLVNGDTASVFTGNLTRAANATSENAGLHAITQGTLSGGVNYTIEYHGADLTINKKALTVTADNAAKTFGAADPASLTYTHSGLVNGDTASVFTGNLLRDNGENAGVYAINRNTLSAGGNYNVIYTPGRTFTINRAGLTVTANNVSKTYGDADPSLTYTYSGLQGTDTAAVFDGSLARAAGETVAGGPYAINQGNLTAGINYTINFTAGRTLTINRATLALTADAKSKIYGDVDPSLTYNVSGLKGSDTASVLTGSLTRAVGETVAGGPYAISQGTVDAGGNYTIAYTGAALTIDRASLTVTAAGQSKVYGAADPTLSYTAAGLKNGDTSAVLTGGLTRAAGETVAGGPYAISQGTLTAGSNYDINYTGNAMTITPAALTVTADNLTKVYGQSDPSLTYTYAGLTNGDTSAVLSGGLTRVAGENKGNYAINQGTLGAGSNYTISYDAGNLSITSATLNIAANAQSKTYGNTDPTLTYATTGLVNGDSLSVLTGQLARATGENVGSYAINQGSLAAGDNYIISYTGNNLAVNQRGITVAADAQTRTYGNANPALTYTVGGLGLVSGDTLSGGLTTTANATSNVGNYGIAQGTLANANYAITYTGNNLTVAQRGITVAADAQSRAYGQANPTLTYTVGGQGLVNGDSLNGSLATTATLISNVGNYGITQGTLGNANYAITYTGNNLAVTQRALTIAINSQSRMYGDANPALTYTVGGLGLMVGDVLTGSLTTSATATSNAGSYAIAQGSLGNANYTINFTAGNLAVTPRTITVAADAQSRIYGNANPALTYAVGGNGLVNGDSLNGSLATTASGTSNVGSYGITQGTLANSNYAITYTGNNLAVTQRAILVAADGQSRVYGNTNPALTYDVGGLGLVNGDTLNGALATTADATSNVGGYAITQGTLAANSNYTMTYAGNNLAVTQRAIAVTADAQSRIYGEANPALTYNVGGLGLVNGDTLGGALTTAANATSNVGNYGIAQGTLTASGNYAMSYTGNNLAVTQRGLTVAANAQSRIYGDTNPALTYALGGLGLVNGDSLSGALATSANGASDVGSYGITQGTLGNANYAISYTGNNLAVTQRTITVAADGVARIYGDANPALTYSVGGMGLVNGDTLGGSLATAATVTSNMGMYAITQGTLADANYAIIYTGNSMMVGQRAITVTANAISRTVGVENPALTYTVGGRGLVNGDTLAGLLATTADQTSPLGTYAITQGTLGATPNYALTYVGADLSVIPAPLAIPRILLMSMVSPDAFPSDGLPEASDGLPASYNLRRLGNKVKFATFGYLDGLNDGACSSEDLQKRLKRLGKVVLTGTEAETCEGGSQ
ncbi:MAG: MBG domain-containing protein [Pseudolabrys sp.]|nr:MBG domain-containing protein [Pseudolabrys sp.]